MPHRLVFLVGASNFLCSLLVVDTFKYLPSLQFFLIKCSKWSLAKQVHDAITLGHKHLTTFDIVGPILGWIFWFHLSLQPFLEWLGYHVFVEFYLFLCKHGPIGFLSHVGCATLGDPCFNIVDFTMSFFTMHHVEIQPKTS